MFRNPGINVIIFTYRPAWFCPCQFCSFHFFFHHLKAKKSCQKPKINKNIQLSVKTPCRVSLTVTSRVSFVFFLRKLLKTLCQPSHLRLESKSKALEGSNFENPASRYTRARSVCKRSDIPMR